MYETVLVPTDGSDISLAAAEEAITLTASDGTIHALGVVEILPLYKQSGRPKLAAPDTTGAREHLEEATQRIQALADDAGIACETAITEGVPHREILDRARMVDADAIVLGKRGLGASSGDLLGSTTERILRGAATTVVSVPE